MGAYAPFGFGLRRIFPSKAFAFFGTSTKVATVRPARNRAVCQRANSAVPRRTPQLYQIALATCKGDATEISSKSVLLKKIRQIRRKSGLSWQSVNNRLQRFFKSRQVIADRIPYDIQIDVSIIMYKSMPHAGPSFEINLWMLCAHCLSPHRHPSYGHRLSAHPVRKVR